MRTEAATAAWLLCAWAATLSACSSCGEAPPAPALPAQVDSGFAFEAEAFSFANFGGAPGGARLTTPLVERMFGAEVACIGGATPCELTPVANAWMTETNRALEQGRSEGFAVAAALFHAGALDPNDFGAPRVADLELADHGRTSE
jgi:hypothetical protein